MPRRRADPGSAAADTVRRALSETKQGLDAHADRVRRYDKAYDIWRSPENEKERRSRPAWQPLLKVKYGMQVVDQAMVNMVQGVPKPRCTPRTQESERKAEAMEHILSYYADMAHIAELQAVIAQQALVYGVSPSKTRWLYKEADQTRLAPAVDVVTGQTIWQPSTRRVVECDRPDMQPWDVYDCWWEPKASSPDNASYVVLRCWPTKDDLMRNAYSEDTGVGTYRNLELLFAAGPGQEPPQTAQNRLLDQQTSPYRDRFEVWEIWRDQSLTVIGNRQILLYDGPKPYWMPGKPITISHSRPDFFQIEGISETELIDHLQQQLHAEDNLRLENLRFTVQRGATVRETVPDMKALVMQPHFMWPVQDHDDVNFVSQPPLPPEAYEEHQTLLSLLQYVTGITPYVTGASAAGTGADQTTATGVSVLSSAAGKLLSFKAEVIARRTWQRTFEQWAALTKQFLRSPVSIRIEGPGEEITWAKYGPEDVFGDYDVKIESAEESLSKQQRRADLVAFTNAVMPAIQTGQIDAKPLWRALAEAFSFPSPDSLFPAQQAQQLAAPQFPSGPTPFTLGNPNGQQQLAPTPMMSVLRGNAR